MVFSLEQKKKKLFWSVSFFPSTPKHLHLQKPYNKRQFFHPTHGPTTCFLLLLCRKIWICSVTATLWIQNKWRKKKNSNAPLNLKPQFQPLSSDKSKRILSDRRRRSNNSNNRLRIWTWKQRKRESQVSQVNMELERKLESIKRMKKLWNWN